LFRSIHFISPKAGDVPYSRLVDFSLSRPEHAALRTAYLEGAVVVTPNPRNHALLADKGNRFAIVRTPAFSMAAA
jgi:hypothetical protein